jgi:hypothetical protein
MWYEKYPGIPPRGSPLERLFTLVYLSRKRTELLSTRALVQVSMPEGREAQDPAIEAFDTYCKQMFPFLDRAVDTEKETARKRLLKFIKKRARIDMRPVWKQQAERARKVAALKRFKMRPAMPGKPYQGSKKDVPTRS